MDRRPVVILMRYSVLKAPTGPKAGWLLLKKNSYADYKAQLFAPERLRERLIAFKTIVLPSLLAQTRRLDDRQHCLVILTSTELPKTAFEALEEMTAAHPWIMLRPLPPQDHIGFAEAATAALDRMGFVAGPFATVRLDDDDGLARKYLEELERLIVDENVGKVVTFPSGFFGKFDHVRGAFTDFYRSYQRFNAQGLAAVHRLEDGKISPAEQPTVYHFGRHGDIGTTGLPYIENPSLPAYLRSIYPTQDSAFRKRDLSEGNRVSREEVAEHVGLGTGVGPGNGWLAGIARRLRIGARSN